MKRLDMLEDLIDYRNPIGHGDETKISPVEAHGTIASTKGSTSITAGRSTDWPVRRTTSSQHS